MNLRPRKRVSPGVEITPLIDVVFLLLIFFMVSTTFDKQTQLKVDLPQADAEQRDEAVPERIDITFDVKGNIYVDERELVRQDVDTLKQALRKIMDGRDDLPVFVSGDRSAPYQAVMTVMDAAAQLGLTQLSFVAREPPDEQQTQGGR